MKKIAILIVYSLCLGVVNFGFAQKQQKKDKHPIEQFYVVINSGVSLLEWTVKGELDWYECVIERSSDGVNFEEIGVKSGIISRNDMKYVFVDKEPNAGENYYRVTKEHTKHYSLSDQSLVVNNVDSELEDINMGNSLVSNR